MKVVCLILVLLLCGCKGRSPVEETDEELHCSKSGKAFVIEPAVGQLSYMKRTPIADVLCAKETK